jgi:hypothetical protein
VQRDLDQNHGRQVAASDAQNVAEWVSSIAEAKEEVWDYALPPLAESIATIAIRLDRAMIPMADSSGRIPDRQAPGRGRPVRRQAYPSHPSASHPGHGRGQRRLGRFAVRR